MKPLLVDSHAHLDFPDFAGDLDEVLDRAFDAGVRYVLTVGTDLASSKRCMEIARSRERVRFSVGIHPHEASEAGAENLKALEALGAKGASAIGEIGLDYYRNRSPREDQRASFRAQLELAGALDLPVIIHSRNAWEETLEILSAAPPSGGGVVHCFSGTPEQAREALSLGLHISFAGPITYPKARDTRETASSVPVERLLVETDAPFLAPQIRRGKRNEPALVTEVARVQAELHGLSVPDLASATTLNARTLFGIGPPIPPGKIAYAIGDSLYVNLTNRCTARCVFCARETAPTVAGHDLLLPAEPTVEEVMEAVRLADPTRFKEVVFCGYGEPTLRLEAVTRIGRALRKRGHRVRLNTNGHAGLIHGRDVTAEIAEAVDDLSVSLNAQDAKTYGLVCAPVFGEETHAAILEFVKPARGRFASISLSAVKGVNGVDIEACRRLAEAMGVDFRERAYR